MRSTASACRSCGCTLTSHEARAGGICADWRCRERELAEVVRLERERAAGITRRPDDASLPSVVVPWRVAGIRPLARGRRRAFLDHLDAELRVAIAAQGAIEPPPGRIEAGPTAPRGERSGPPARPGAAAAGPRPEPATTGPEPATPVARGDEEAGDPPLLGPVCGACRGACCHTGGTHAYLDAARLARELTRHGGDAAAVRRQYEARIPARTVVGSCVFHTASGCALPREIRADLCNRYECGGLKRARELAEAGAERLHVVVREDHRIRGSAFVDGEGIRRVRPRREGYPWTL